MAILIHAGVPFLRHLCISFLFLNILCKVVSVAFLLVVHAQTFRDLHTAPVLTAWES